MRFLRSMPCAITVAVLLLIAGSMVFAETVATDEQWLGALASGLSVGAAGLYVGAAARIRSRRR